LGHPHDQRRLSMNTTRKAKIKVKDEAEFRRWEKLQFSRK
jgi:hypothetical protein